MKKKIFLSITVAVLAIVLLTGCGNKVQTENSIPSQTEETQIHSVTSSSGPELRSDALRISKDNQANAIVVELNKEDEPMQMNIQVGDRTFTATLEKNKAVDALVKVMEQKPITIQMSDYSGFEKVGHLGRRLPASNQQTTTQAGDIVLYQSNQIVLFYGPNSWSYTRLGRINDLTGWEEALGSGNVTVTFSLEK